MNILIKFLFLGSVRDAIEFHKLSVDESKERLKKLLIKMDLNGDGFIERHELKAWILRSFKYAYT